MTKTLTENKWFYTENGIKDASWNIVFKSEVLAPVPSYDEHKANEELLHQEIKESQKNALKASRLIFEKRRLLSENKKLKAQLNEANEVIESLRTYDFTVDDENAESYQVKWNVKAKRLYKNKKWGVK